MMNQYYLNIPGVAGPLTVYGHDEQSARKSARDRFGFGNRLPRGTKVFLKPAEQAPGVTHTIRFNGQSVTCYEHTNESVIELTRRYYEGEHNFKCSITDRTGKEIYKTA